MWFCESLATAAVTAVAKLAGAARSPHIRLPVISYSVYLMHAVLLDALVFGLPAARKFPFYLSSIPLFVIATLVVSVVTNRFVERPFETAAQKGIRYKMA